jgi:hypothetical protein
MTLLNKISSIIFDQGFIERIFGYGTITIVTAGEKVPFIWISYSDEFRKIVIQQIEAYNEIKLKQQVEAVAKGFKFK